MAKKPVDDKAAEKERIKKQLGVLAVLMILVVGVNFKSIKKMFGGKGKARGRRGRQVARRNARGTPAARPRAAAPARAAAKAALTPDMIPILDAQTRQKIKDVKDKPKEPIEEDEIRYDTRNPFVPLNEDDREIQKRQEKARQAPVMRVVDEDPETAASKPGAGGVMYFRGVIPMKGERYAVVHGSTMRRPKPITEGSRIKGTPWTLLSIGPKDAFVVLHNPLASRVREKISVVHRDNIRPEELALAKEILLASSPDVDKERRGSDSEQLAPYYLALAEERARQAAEAGASVAGAPAASGDGLPAGGGDFGGATGGGDDFSDFEFADDGGDEPAGDTSKTEDSPTSGGDGFGDDDFQFFDQ